MSYIKTNWQDDDLITYEKLNKVENELEQSDLPTAFPEQKYWSLTVSADMEHVTPVECVSEQTITTTAGDSGAQGALLSPATLPAWGDQLVDATGTIIVNGTSYPAWWNSAFISTDGFEVYWNSKLDMWMLWTLEAGTYTIQAFVNYPALKCSLTAAQLKNLHKTLQVSTCLLLTAILQKKLKIFVSLWILSLLCNRRYKNVFRN